MTNDALQPSTEEQEALIQELLEIYGREIGTYIAYLDIPDLHKEVLVEDILPTLSADELETLRTNLQEALVEQTAIEMTPEYQEQVAQIDRETIEEIEAIINEE